MAVCYSVCTADICSTYRAPNEVWNYNGSGTSVSAGCSANVTFPTGTGSTIYDENIERLWGAINDERSRRGYGAYNFQTIAGSSSPDNATPLEIQSTDNSIVHGNNAGNYDQFIKMKAAINEMIGIISYTVVDGTPVPYSSIGQLRNNLDFIRSLTICPTDCGPNTICSCYVACSCHTYVPPPPPPPALAVTYIGFTRVSADTAGHTTTLSVSLPSGTGSVIVCGHTKQSGFAKRRITSVTVGGNTATKYVDAIRDSSEYNAHSSIWGYSYGVSTSGSINIVVNWDNGGGYDGVGFEVYAINKGLTGLPATDSYFPDSVSSDMPIVLKKYDKGVTFLCWCNYFNWAPTITSGMPTTNMQWHYQLYVSCWEIATSSSVFDVTYLLANGDGGNDGQTACGIVFKPTELIDV